MKKFVLDTNIILQGLETIETLYDNENEFVITETIVNEIDKFKNGNEEINYNAREFNRLLAESKIIKTDFNFIVYQTSLGIFYIYKDIAHNFFNSNDDCIIKTITHYYKKSEIKFISNDIVFRIKVALEGYEAEPFFNNIRSLPNFTEEFIIDSMMLNKEYFSINEIKELLNSPKNFNKYSYIKIIDPTGKPFYLIRKNKNTFELFQDDIKNLFGIKPKNLEQKIFLKLLLGDNDIVVANALAGSGKTLLSLIAGMKLFQQGKIDSIKYIRRTILSGDKLDELGFLPGSLEEKINGYIYPLRDNIELLIKLKNKKKKKWSKEELEEAVKNFEKQYNIEYIYEGHLRGRNLSGYIIIDEAQNDSVSTIRTILSRVMEGSKVVVIGSIEQIDNPYLNKYDNALTFLLNQCGTFDPIQIQGIKLNKTERSRIVEWIENLF
jgi:PhoH-like ATPase